MVKLCEFTEYATNKKVYINADTVRAIKANVRDRPGSMIVCDNGDVILVDQELANVVHDLREGEN